MMFKDSFTIKSSNEKYEYTFNLYYYARSFSNFQCFDNIVGNGAVLQKMCVFKKLNSLFLHQTLPKCDKMPTGNEYKSSLKIFSHYLLETVTLDQMFAFNFKFTKWRKNISLTLSPPYAA